MIQPEVPQVPEGYINDIMILGKGVELWQLTADPGVLEGKRVLENTADLIRLKGDWIRFPTVSGLLAV
jgi:hypothetical protein